MHDTTPVTAKCKGDSPLDLTRKVNNEQKQCIERAKQVLWVNVHPGAVAAKVFWGVIIIFYNFLDQVVATIQIFRELENFMRFVNAILGGVMSPTTPFP